MTDQGITAAPSDCVIIETKSIGIGPQSKCKAEIATSPFKAEFKDQATSPIIRSVRPSKKRNLE